MSFIYSFLFTHDFPHGSVSGAEHLEGCRIPPGFQQFLVALLAPH